MACSFMVGTLESLRNQEWAPPMVAAGPDAGQDGGLGPRAVRRGYGYADPSSGHRHARSVAHESSAADSSAEPPPPGWRGADQSMSRNLRSRPLSSANTD